MACRRFAQQTSAALLALAAGTARAESYTPHSAVEGVEVTTGDVRRVGGPWRNLAWDDLETTRLEAGAYELRFRA
ncbi:MAG: hypothetical protein M3O36_04670, partial [Myxococcota bacterium]|nr:hypothetical protein [Myxococcota bacterium]